MLSINLIYADKKQPILDDIAPTVTVSHYDCSEMSENNLYSLNQVKPCNVAPENIDMSHAKVKMYTKHFRTEINATICSVKHQRNRFYCGMHDQSSIDIKQKTITSYLNLSPAQCRLAAEGSPITLLNHQITMKKGIIEQHLRWNGDADDTFKNECDGYEGFEWIEKDTFETHIQDITLNVKLRDGTIMNRNGQPLSCKLDELGCDSTSLDPYAYVWDNPDNCILTVLKEEYVNMIKNDDQYYIDSKNDSENKYLFEIKNRPQKLCNKPSDVYPTTYESLFVAILYGGFDMKTGRNMIQQEDRVHKMLHSPNDQERDEPGHCKLWVASNYQSDPYYGTWLNMDYELQQGTKLDYLFFESSRALKASELHLLKNQCEQERSHILTILMLSLENSRLAGYMLTGNRSTFLETDGSLAWLYSCPLVKSPFHTMNECYDKIPIFYKGQIKFVDPITRQTLPDAMPQNCSDHIKNFFQMDMDNKNSWFSLTPQITHRDRPAIFSPKDVAPFTRDQFAQSINAGMYTKGQLTEFWDNILMSSASKNALQKFTRKLIVPSQSKKGPEGYTYYAPKMDFFVDNMISPGYIESKFRQTFGTIGYWLEKCGIWFAVFLFIKLIIDVTVTIVRAFEIHRLTGASVGIGKILLSATYNLFMVSIFHSMFNPTTKDIPMTTFSTENQDASEHIYPVINRLPASNRLDTISPI